MRKLYMESEGAFHAFAYFMFECPNCKDTERRLLPRNHPMVVDGASTLTADIAVCEQATIHRAKAEATPQGEAVNGRGKVDHFLDDPVKFIERFVRNREHSHTKRSSFLWAFTLIGGRRTRLRRRAGTIEAYERDEYFDPTRFFG